MLSDFDIKTHDLQYSPSSISLSVSFANPRAHRNWLLQSQSRAVTVAQDVIYLSSNQEQGLVQQIGFGSSGIVLSFCNLSRI